MTSMMDQHEELRRTSVIALDRETIVRMAADGQDPSRFSYRVWQQAVRQLLEDQEDMTVLEDTPRRVDHVTIGEGPTPDPLDAAIKDFLDEQPVHAYGHCPTCSEPGMARERRLNGNDKCTAGHVYPSASAVLCQDQDSCLLGVAQAREVSTKLDELQRLGQEFDRANTTAEGETSG